MTRAQPPLRSQRLRLVNHQGDALRLGMNWTEEDLGKPQVLVDSADGMGHPGTFPLPRPRRRGAMQGPCIGHVAPEAIEGGPIALVAGGDLIEINVPRRLLAIVGTDGEHRAPDEVEAILTERRRIWKPLLPRHDSGILSLYSRVARGAPKGASIT